MVGDWIVGPPRREEYGAMTPGDELWRSVSSNVDDAVDTLIDIIISIKSADERRRGAIFLFACRRADNAGAQPT